MADETEKNYLDKLQGIIHKVSSCDQDLATLEVTKNKAAKDRVIDTLSEAHKLISDLMLKIKQI